MYFIIKDHHYAFSEASLEEATLIAEMKLYKPSEPISLEDLMAPVITTGSSISSNKSSRNAVSSKVSVP